MIDNAQQLGTQWRVAARFRQLRQEKRKGLIPFCTAGDPSVESTVPLLHAMVAAGADLLEIGVPFSDPMADGKVIQRSSERALQKGVTLPMVLQMVREFRATDTSTPIILMGYMNPVEAMGLARFAKQASTAGVDAVLLVDLPVEEASGTLTILNGCGLSMVFLVAPTTSKIRLHNICNMAKKNSFVYCVSLKGVTGSAAFDAVQVRQRVADINARADVPVAVGFGIRDASTAALVADCADAVVVGSALVEKLENASGMAAWEKCATDFIGELRSSIDAVGKRA